MISNKERWHYMDKIREELAKYAHDQWSGWMEYLFSKCINYKPNDVQADLGAMIIPKWAVERWQKQIKTSYKDLSEEEKNSDRSEANGMLKIQSRDEEIKKYRDAIREARNYTTPMDGSMTDWYNHIQEILGKALED